MHVSRMVAVSLALVAALVVAPVAARADGNVQAFVTNQSLYVYGDDVANTIQITQGGSPGEFVVTGFSGTSVNGAFLPVTVTGAVNDVQVEMNGGDDDVTLFAASIGRNLAVKMESGTDVLALLDLDVAKNATLSGGDANDDLALDDVHVGGKLKIKTERGDDTLTVTDTTVARNTKLSGGAGNDTVEVSACTFDNKLVVTTSAGADVVDLYDVAITGKASVSLGADNDDLTIGQIICTSRMILNGGPGANTFTNGGGNSIADGPVLKKF